MNHLSDKELDRLSREAAEQADVEPTASGWDRLHQRLEKDVPPQSEKQRRRFLFLLLFFALITGGGLVYRYATSPVVVTQKAFSGKKKELTNGNRKVDPGMPGEKNKPSFKPAGNQLETPASTDQLTKTTSLLKMPGTKNNDVSIATDPKKIETPEQIYQKIPHITTGSLKGVRKNTLPTPGVVYNAKLTANDKVEESAEPRSPMNKVSAENDKQDSVTETSKRLTPPATVAVDTLAIAVKKAQPPLVTRQPLVIGWIAGPDFTTVKFTHYSKPGYIAGVSISWQITKRFSVNTGAVYTKKNYAAHGEDYHPPKSYWTNNIKLDQLSGSCWMIDIPLNGRFELNKNSQRKIFVSGGLSTYLMKKEIYTYYYLYNGNYVNRGWTNNKNSNFILSVLNLSAGYEKKLNKHFSIQAEPYLKIPVKGVGFGKLQMNSYGIYFSMRYHPSFKVKGKTSVKTSK